jgi:phosphate transport system protein
MERRHTDRQYEEELRGLQECILAMGAAAQEMIAGSVSALCLRDSALAAQIIERDDEVDRLELEIDARCLRILARRQPVASDLRFVATALKIVKDLERIGDSAANIAGRVLELNQQTALEHPLEFPRMAELVRGMVQEALAAFVARDAERALQVIERDRAVDELYARSVRELLDAMMEDRRGIAAAMRCQSIAKYLERIGDHAKNVAEMVVFMVQGEDIRHRDGSRRGRLP